MRWQKETMGEDLRKELNTTFATHQATCYCFKYTCSVPEKQGKKAHQNPGIVNILLKRLVLILFCVSMGFMNLMTLPFFPFPIGK